MGVLEEQLTTLRCGEIPGLENRNRKCSVVVSPTTSLSPLASIPFALSMHEPFPIILLETFLSMSTILYSIMIE